MEKLARIAARPGDGGRGHPLHRQPPGSFRDHPRRQLAEQARTNAAAGERLYTDAEMRKLASTVG